MTDEKDQASTEKPAPKYRALRDGVGYKKNHILIAKAEIEIRDISSGTSYGGIPYGRDNFFIPLFSEVYLENSPDFEEVEELWKPEKPKGDEWFILSVSDIG